MDDKNSGSRLINFYDMSSGSLGMIPVKTPLHLNILNAIRHTKIARYVVAIIATILESPPVTRGAAAMPFRLVTYRSRIGPFRSALTALPLEVSLTVILFILGGCGPGRLGHDPSAGSASA
ncbi:MAG: hypothetical protein ABSA13_05150 [Beijerinckiaceae bacterium]|jgi:hypothetical protein